MSEKKNEVTTVLQNEKEQSLQSFILTQLDKFFIEHIPISTFKEMDPFCKIISFSLIISFMNLETNISIAIDMYVFGGLAYFLFGGLFVYFTVESYYANYKQAFISLNSNAGSCSTVPITISNSYLAGLYSAFFFHFIITYYTTTTNTVDSRGNWIGTAPFNYYLALYSLSLNGFSITSNSQYNSMMSSFQAALQNIGIEGNVNNLGFNIILWCSFISYYNIQSPGVYPF